MSTVSIVKCDNYEPENIRNSLLQNFENLGGSNSFIKSGNKILLKVNLLSAKNPERAITTHPALVEELAKIILDLGAIPMIGDSPGGAIKGVKRYWEKTGMQKVADKLNIELVNFETAGTYKFDVNGRTLNLAKPIFDADLVINLPKLKTHGFTLMTGAVKNMYGAIPGLKKAMYHKENPAPVQFAKLLLDIYTICNPKLTIMDAVIGMEGQGPSSGKPRKIGLLLASRDGMAIDTVAAKIIGYDPKEIDTIGLAVARKLHKMEKIKIIGENLESVKIPDFDLVGHEGFWRVARWAMNNLGNVVGKLVDNLMWIRPRANHDACTRCQFCIKSCPVNAMKLENNKVVVDYDKCIHCLCCHELCPENAIEMEMSFLAKKFA